MVDDRHAAVPRDAGHAVAVPASPQPAATPPQQRTYECERGCGFLGTFEVCSAHEMSCTFGDKKGPRRPSVIAAAQLSLEQRQAIKVPGCV